MSFSVGSEQSAPSAAQQVAQQEASTIHRLVQTSHEQHAALRSLELQLNHSQLQVQALSSREVELRQQVDVLQFTIASTEQDKLLLESKLQDIAGFEGPRNCALSLKDVRGKLLHVANNKIGELTRALQQTQLMLEEARSGEDQEQKRITFENQALREEVTRIGEQLAQRTVLYSAQERRYHDATRTYGSLTTEKETENIQLRARLQQLEQQYEKSDRAHLEAVLVSRQLEEANRRAQVQLAEAVERVRVLDAEVADLSTQNISLHATVERLRGADYVDLERDLMAEVEAIRADAKSREDALRRQLDNAQEILSSEAERREQLVDEVESLRHELTEQSNVLREASSRGLIRLPSGFVVASVVDDISATRADATSHADFDTVSSSELRLDASLIGANASKRHNIGDKSADNSIFAAMFGTMEEAGLPTDAAAWDELSTHRDDDGQVRTGPAQHRYGSNRSGEDEQDEGDDEEDYSEDELSVRDAPARAKISTTPPRSFTTPASKDTRRNKPRLGHALGASTSDLHLPLMAASSLQTVKALLVEWFNKVQSASHKQQQQQVPKTASVFSATAMAAESDKRLCGVLMKLSKSAAKQEQRQSLDLWKDAKRMTIEAVQSSSSLGPAASDKAKALERDPSLLWDDVTALLLQILTFAAEKHPAVLVSTAAAAESLRESQQSGGTCLSKNFLLGAHSEDGGTAESSFVSNSTGHVPSSAEGLLKEELACLKEELIQRNRREVRLRAALKEQGAKLAIVLKRAAELSVPLPARVSASMDSSSFVSEAQHKQLAQDLAKQTDLVGRFQGEIGVLRQQLDGFREELACAEKQAESSRQLGFAEAAEVYSASLRQLEAELKQAKASLASATAAVSATAVDAKAAEPAVAPVAGESEEVGEELQAVRSQVRTLKQALVDSYRELESLQAAVRSSSPDRSKTQQRSEVSTAEAGVPAQADSEDKASEGSVNSTSFCSAYSQAQTQTEEAEGSNCEEDEARKSMEEALRSHLQMWDARADNWTHEQTVILRKLEEAQLALAQLSAKYEGEKRVALLALRSNLECDHDEALTSLRAHHREEVVALIARLQKEHGEAMMAATEAMQLQLHRLIASLTQDHQEELQRVSLAAEMSISAASHARDSSNTSGATTADVGTSTDAVDQGADMDLSSSVADGTCANQEVAALVNADFEGRLFALKSRHESDLGAALARLEAELCVAHAREKGELESSQLEREQRHEEEKRALIAKYRGRLKQQQADFVTEREQLMALVQQEYADTCALVEENVRSSLERGAAASASASRDSGSFIVYPEMLSPEATSELMNSIASRPWRGDADSSDLLVASSTDSWRSWHGLADSSAGAGVSLVERTPDKHLRPGLRASSGGLVGATGLGSRVPMVGGVRKNVAATAPRKKAFR